MTQVKIKLEEILAQLETVRATKGEAVYQQARRDLAISVLQHAHGEEFVRNAFPDLDIAQLRKEGDAIRAKATEMPTMAQLLQQQLPSIRTQAHFDTFIAAFEAFRVTLDSYFTGDTEKAAKAREALNTALDTAKNVNSLVERLEEIPDDMRSPMAKAATAPPTQFHELDRQRQLLVELAGISTRAGLDNWYVASKATRDQITGQKLRNELHDAIREKRLELDTKETN